MSLSTRNQMREVFYQYYNVDYSNKVSLANNILLKSQAINIRSVATVFIDLLLFQNTVNYIILSTLVLINFNITMDQSFKILTNKVK